MGQNLGINAILERRYQVAAVRVVFRVGREDDHQVERDPDVEASDLDIFFLHNVEEANLNARLQVRKLIDRKDTAIRARNNAEMNCTFMRVVKPL